MYQIRCTQSIFTIDQRFDRGHILLFFFFCRIALYCMKYFHILPFTFIYLCFISLLLSFFYYCFTASFLLHHNYITIIYFIIYLILNTLRFNYLLRHCYNGIISINFTKYVFCSTSIFKFLLYLGYILNIKCVYLCTYMKNKCIM